MIRTRGFIFRETVVHAVMVWYFTCIGISRLVCRRVCSGMTHQTITAYITVFLKMNSRVRNTKKTSKFKKKYIYIYMYLERVLFVGLHCITLFNVTFYVPPTGTCAHKGRGIICSTWINTYRVTEVFRQRAPSMIWFFSIWPQNR